MGNKSFVVIGTLSLIMIVLLLFPQIDSTIVTQVQSMRNETLDTIMLFFTHTAMLIAFILLASTILFYKKENRIKLVSLWISLVLTLILTDLLKITVNRTRPFESIGFELPKNYGDFETGKSFPSKHASLVFTVIPFLKDGNSMRIYYLYYLFSITAILISFSRVYFGFHYLSDVIAGSLLGYGLSFAAIGLNKIIFSRINKQKKNEKTRK